MTAPDWGSWPDVREQERLERDRHRERTDALRAAIALADRLLAIGRGDGYAALQRALEDMLRHRTETLFSVRVDRDAAVLQGRCQELRAVLSLMRDTQANRDALAKELEECENAFREREALYRNQEQPT